MKAKHNFNSAHFAQYIAADLQRSANTLILQYQNNLKRTLSIAGTGKLYRGGRQGKGSLRRRSVPGAPPAVDTGELRRSVQSQPILTSKRSSLIRFVIAGVKKYGFMLDAGTGRIAARPWIARSADPVRAVAASVVQRSLNKAIRTYRPPSPR